ncbi:hypothetical protein [Streptomyces sp. Ncost-T10-10d]|uniref:hypothetical protein n=1 Tax=Streptomyces sp. Ncost-T10-10d TaxID=1839774 RepID=UPI00081E86E7|nr:hypothetical protein [Streptomyces sp. Ncost-T10-10d]SCF61834.1 hypothetical protein GA0115254_108029 [Streptomyces sp. Ncost-T10-10d]
MLGCDQESLVLVGRWRGDAEVQCGKADRYDTGAKPADIAGLSTLQAALLSAATPHDSMHRIPLQRLLADANSLCTIRADGRALARRVDPVVAAVTDVAAKAADRPERCSATRHLRQAFDAAYALQPDPVKAYSEAIKAGAVPEPAAVPLRVRARARARTGRPGSGHRAAKSARAV